MNRDEEYFSALEKSDTDTARAIIEEEARNAGIVCSSDGTPVVFFHGTSENFSIFHSSPERELGVHITPSRSVAEDRCDANIIRLYVSFSNPFDIVSDLGEWSNVEMWREYLSSYYLEEDGEGRFTRKEVDDLRTPADILRLLREKNIDSIMYENGFEGPSYSIGIPWSRESVIVFDPRSIKSAETVVRNDAGEVVPPSLRFDMSSPDIRGRVNWEKADGLIFKQPYVYDWSYCFTNRETWMAAAIISPLMKEELFEGIIEDIQFGAMSDMETVVEEALSRVAEEMKQAFPETFRSSLQSSLLSQAWDKEVRHAHPKIPERIDFDQVAKKLCEDKVRRIVRSLSEFSSQAFER